MSYKSCFDCVFSIPTARTKLNIYCKKYDKYFNDKWVCSKFEEKELFKRLMGLRYKRIIRENIAKQKELNGEI